METVLSPHVKSHVSVISKHQARINRSFEGASSNLMDEIRRDEDRYLQQLHVLCFHSLALAVSLHRELGENFRSLFFKWEALAPSEWPEAPIAEKADKGTSAPAGEPVVGDHPLRDGVDRLNESLAKFDEGLATLAYATKVLSLGTMLDASERLTLIYRKWSWRLYILLNRNRIALLKRAAAKLILFVLGIAFKSVDLSEPKALKAIWKNAQLIAKEVYKFVYQPILGKAGPANAAMRAARKELEDTFTSFLAYSIAVQAIISAPNLDNLPESDGFLNDIVQIVQKRMTANLDRFYGELEAEPEPVK